MRRHRVGRRVTVTSSVCDSFHFTVRRETTDSQPLRPNRTSPASTCFRTSCQSLLTEIQLIKVNVSLVKDTLSIDLNMFKHEERFSVLVLFVAFLDWKVTVFHSNSTSQKKNVIFSRSDTNRFFCVCSFPIYFPTTGLKPTSSPATVSFSSGSTSGPVVSAENNDIRNHQLRANPCMACKHVNTVMISSDPKPSALSGRARLPDRPRSAVPRGKAARPVPGLRPLAVLDPRAPKFKPLDARHFISLSGIGLLVVIVN